MCYIFPVFRLLNVQNERGWDHETRSWIRESLWFCFSVEEYIHVKASDLYNYLKWNTICAFCLSHCLCVCFSVSLLSICCFINELHDNLRLIVYVLLTVCINICELKWWSFGLLPDFFLNIKLFQIKTFVQWMRLCLECS